MTLQRSVTSSASSITLLVANANRKGWSLFNDSTQVLYLLLGATRDNTDNQLKATSSAYTVQVTSNAYYEIPTTLFDPKDPVYGIWASANGSARITEGF